MKKWVQNRFFKVVLERQMTLVIFLKFDSSQKDINSIGKITETLFQSEKYAAASKQFCPTPKIGHREMFSITILLPGELKLKVMHPFPLPLSK